MHASSCQWVPQDHPSISDDIGKKVQKQPLNLADYTYGEVYSRVDQTVDPSHPLCDIDKTHCSTLAELFCNYTFRCMRELVTIYFSAALTPAGLSHAVAVHPVDCDKVLKEDCHMVMLSGRHWRHLVRMVSDVDHLAWAAEPLRMRYAFRIDGKSITPAQAIKQTTIGNSSTTISASRKNVLLTPYRFSSTMRGRLKNTTRWVFSMRVFWKLAMIWYHRTFELQTPRPSMHVIFASQRWWRSARVSGCYL